jgi:hypothetical protein
LGPATTAERKAVIEASPFQGVYEKVIDRESAFEMLLQRAEKAKEEAPEARRMDAPKPKKGRQRQSVLETMGKSVARTLGSSLGRQIVRGLLGSIFKGR